jgi:hypothetical protein
VLEQAIGESARRGADIDDVQTAGLQFEMIERVLEFPAAAADKFFGRIER